MSNSYFTLVGLFLLLIFLQIFLFNNLIIFSFYIPFPYLVLVLMFPVNYSAKGLYLYSFLLGLSIDFFINTGGIHATSCLLMAGLRNYFIELTYGIKLQFQPEIEFKFKREMILYIVISVLFHHAFIFILEAFSWQFFFKIFGKIILSSIYTIVMILLMLSLVKPQIK